VFEKKTTVEIQKALPVCFLVLLIIFTIQIFPLENGHDYSYHLTKTMDLGVYDTQDYYPPLFHVLARPFAFRESTFYLFALVIIGLFTPIALVLVTKDWKTAFLFFGCTSYFYFFELGAYPQAMAFLLCILALRFSCWWQRIGLLMVGALTHSLGFQAVAIFSIAAYLKEQGFFGNLKHLFFPSVVCSGWFPKNEGLATVLEKRVLIPEHHGTIWPLKETLSIGEILRFFLETTPLPFLLMGLKGLYDSKAWHLILLTFLFLVLGFFNDRILFLIAIPMLIGLTHFINSIKSVKYKIVFWLVVFGYGIILFFLWWRFKTNCLPF